MMRTGTKLVGFGDADFKLALCLANRPPLPEYEQLHDFVLVKPGELARIVEQTGNHWRKIFNILAKLAYELCDRGLLPQQDGSGLELASWQEYRDVKLLQPGSGVAVLFSSPLDGLLEKGKLSSNSPWLLVSGKSYAESIGVYTTPGRDRSSMKLWGEHFQFDKDAHLVLTPYFDYRQLSNVKLSSLVELLEKTMV